MIANIDLFQRFDRAQPLSFTSRAIDDRIQSIKIFWEFLA